MKVLNSLLDLPTVNGDQPEVGLTIGNFDGVHLGHRNLLSKISNDCQSKGLSFVVMTFIPHPQKILRPEIERFLITSYNKRRALLADSGVDYLVELKFTRDFSTLSPTEFLQNYLFNYSKLKHLYLGYDFAFGANKQGDHDFVKSLCRPAGVLVETQSVFEHRGVVISSSLIREKLSGGRMDEVCEILARPFSLEGLVVKGEGRGKKIGFPTANIQVPQDLLIPQRGVYITQTIYAGMTFKSITNIGTNPTFKEADSIHVETHLLDFDSDIYGEALEIQFLKKIREEKKFPTVNDLIAQIKQDAEFAKDFFSRNS